MVYDQVYYSWLRDRDYKGNPYTGWGIAATSNNNPGFISKALRQVSQVKVPEDYNSTADYYEYSENFGCFVRIGVRKLPPLEEMGGADNNRLVCLYVPVSDSDKTNSAGEIPIPIRYPEFIPQTLQAGTMPRFKTDAPVYDYQKILEKYGFSRKDGTQGLHSLAVLLAMRFLSFVSPEWKQLIITIDRMPGADVYSTASELTWMLEKLIPEQLFGKTKTDYLKETCYRAGDFESKYLGISYVAGISGPDDFGRGAGENRNRLNQRHRFELFRYYDCEAVFTGSGLDRKTSGCAGLFERLAGKAQEGPEVYQLYLHELCGKSDVDSVYRLNMRYKERFDTGFSGSGFFDTARTDAPADGIIREDKTGYNSGVKKPARTGHKSGFFDLMFAEDDKDDNSINDSLFEDDLITEEDPVIFGSFSSKENRKKNTDEKNEEKGLLDFLFADEDED